MESGSSSFGVFHTSQHSTRCFLSDSKGQCFQHIADHIHVDLVISYNAVGSTHKFNVTANVICKEKL